MTKTEADQPEILFSWAHIADLYAGPPRSGMEQGSRVDAMCDDLRRTVDTPAVDAILVTGDIAWSGAAMDSEEYTLAQSWLHRLAAAAGVGVDRVFTVPGNHDVQRSADKEEKTLRRMVQAVRAGDEPLDGVLADLADRRLIALRLKNYLQFSSEFAPSCLEPDIAPEDRLYWVHQIAARGGLIVRLAGLNTALVADGTHNDETTLRLGVAQLEQTLTNPALQTNEVVLTLSHHSLLGGWLADEADVYPWLRNYSHVCLSGSLHDKRGVIVRAPSDGPIQISTGGFAPEYRYQRAAIVRRDDGQLYVRVWTRLFSREDKTFRADENAATNRDFLELPLSRQLARQQAPSASDFVRSLSSALFEGPGGIPVRTAGNFVGRSAEMRLLAASLRDAQPHNPVWLIGEPGMGKSTLAQQFVLGPGRAIFPDGSVWLDAADMENELIRVARRFGWTPASRPKVIDARQWLDDVISQHRVLVIIDRSLASNGEEFPIFGGASRTLVLSRKGSATGQTGTMIPLGPLDNASCRVFLRQSVPPSPHITDDKLERLAHAVRGTPVLLRVLAGVGVLNLTNPGVINLASILDGLPESQRSVLVALAVCARATRTRVVARIANLSDEETESTLRCVAAKGLVRYDPAEDRPWGLHEALRIDLREDERWPELRVAHQEYVLDILEQPATKAQKAIQTDMAELITAVDRWIDEEDGESAAIYLSMTFELLSHAAIEHRFLSRYRQVLSMLPETDDKVKALFHLGYYERETGNLDVAIDLFTRAINLAKSLPWNDGMIRALDALAGCYQLRGELASAIIHFSQALELARQDEKRGLEMRIQGHLAGCLADLGNFDDAITEYQRQLAVARDLDSAQDVATTLANLAECYRRTGNWQQSIEFAHEALKHALRLKNPVQLGNAYEVKGQGHAMVGEIPSAIEMFTKALSLYEETHRIQDQARILANLGECHLELQETDEALQTFAKADELYRIAGLPEDHPFVGRIRATNAAVRLGGIPKQHDAFYLTRVEVRSVCSIESYCWEVPFEKSCGWHVLLGDNGAGKTSFLRAIAFTLTDPSEVMAYRPTLNRWLRNGTDEARIELALSRKRSTNAGLQFVDGFNESMAKPSRITLRLGVSLKLERDLLNAQNVFRDDLHLVDRKMWNASPEAFTAGYGPFRRFVGAKPEYERQFSNPQTIARHASLFDSNVALAESLAWLFDLQKDKRADLPGGKWLDPIVQIINSTEDPPLLPHGAQLDTSNNDIRIVDGQGAIVPIEDLSDGYRSILSLCFDILKQLIEAFGPERVFSKDDPGRVQAGGIVLIDEIDVHLHTTWQRLIGHWFKTRFPKVQFLVTTHSPLVCQAADTVFLLPEPGTDAPARMLVEGIELDRLRYGNVLEAMSNSVFGRGVMRSEESKRMLDELVDLNRKELDEGLTAQEVERQRYLRSVLPTAAPLRRRDERGSK